ncbi:MAG: hypothetical protein GY805_20110 [Chloroflexi bacterium]|nr:hypothetical protein [Chloroflexota bacterium]
MKKSKWTVSILLLVLAAALFSEKVSASTITDGVLADIYPRELSTTSRETFIVGDVLPSENGRFIALISRHVYAPQDVLLLTQTP